MVLIPLVARLCRSMMHCSITTGYLNHILVRHEQGAIHAAQVMPEHRAMWVWCLVTSGPWCDKPGYRVWQMPR